VTNTTKIGLGVNVVVLALVLIGFGYAQRPPEIDPTGAAYLRVNINPTDVPPMVNINPGQFVPRVRVTELPEIRITPRGCENRQSYQTGVGRSISGPMMITYLHLPEQTRVTLGEPGGSHSMNLGGAGQITTAIFLQANQRMEFSSDIMYSGCRPD
jgi:hypothetical protein